MHAVYLPRPRIEISGPQGRAGDLRLAGRPRQRRRSDVHGDPDQRHRGVLTMLTLDLTNEPRWHDLVPGVRVQLRPLTTAPDGGDAQRSRRGDHARGGVRRGARGRLRQGAGAPGRARLGRGSAMPVATPSTRARRPSMRCSMSGRSSRPSSWPTSRRACCLETRKQKNGSALLAEWSFGGGER